MSNNSNEELLSAMFSWQKDNYLPTLKHAISTFPVSVKSL